MKVVKRSEYCEKTAKQEPVEASLRVSDIEKGTVFSGRIKGWSRGTFYRYSNGAIRLGYHDQSACADARSFDTDLMVLEYKKLDVTLVIED